MLMSTEKSNYSINPGRIKEFFGKKLAPYLVYTDLYQYGANLYIWISINGSDDIKMQIRYKSGNGYYYVYIPIADLEIPVMYDAGTYKNRRKHIRKLVSIISLNNKEDVSMYILKFIESELVHVNRNNLGPIDILYRIKLFSSLDVISRVLDGFHNKSYQKVISNEKIY